MKKLLLILILFIPFTVSAQKLLKPTVDKLTGDTIWSTSKEKLYMHGNYLTGQGEAVVCFLKSTKGAKGLVLNIQSTNQAKFPVFVKEGKANFKLADGSIVTLTCVSDDYSISGSTVAIAGSSFGLFGLSPADIEKLSTQNITFIRLETTAGNFDCDIKTKNAEMFKKQFAVLGNH
ncbi:hypothetical protein INP83_07350 [Mucilaginibacter sp. 21P]|uniref:hypothetical protein n=1 Tax=Mucilaginibacter sp. 21P TaxID=2778902 RepID=UPI001C574C10|nr:hypothetical protein [Mucilaginibacter sp. 21P]QXV66889.1 hypothetical protein INP83_07350 [Mucilaginibacter sp. 21P]